VLLAFGDIGERDDGAVDEVVEVSVRADLHQVGASLPRNGDVSATPLLTGACSPALCVGSAPPS
jgi:hypothetical protein